MFCEVTVTLTFDFQNLIIHQWVQVDVIAKFEEIPSRAPEKPHSQELDRWMAVDGTKLLKL